MEPKRLSLFVAYIKCGSPSQSVLDTHGEYHNMLIEMLNSMASTLEWGEVNIDGLGFDATKGFLPNSGTIDAFDAVVVTGSSYSAYDNNPWVTKLGIYEEKPKIRLFGSCFGHQMICKALFKPSPLQPDLPPHTPVVFRNPKGWELGVHPIELSPEFMARFGPVLSNPNSPPHMRLRLIHQDNVNPDSLPDDFINVGRSEGCQVQGVYEKGRVLTLQGNPEFDKKVMVEFGKPIIEKGHIDTVKSGPDDYGYTARAILGFFLEDADEKVTDEVAEGTAAE
ncbi:hypothetical protein VE03_05775 [Pseudogymnoascus sp. 23342-1-I1]|nr:hypothetical protein VE03_05775 [Pseudogymnoascus sp. 23342-1-I1]